MDSPLGRIGYALACIAVPVLWGFVIVWISEWLERKARQRHDREIPPIEFHI